MGREAARRATIAAVKGCVTGRTETSRERKIRLEHAEKGMEVLAGKGDSNPEPKRYGSEVEFAEADIARCQARGDAPPDWAVRAVKQHKEARRARMKALDDEGKRRGYGRATMGIAGMNREDESLLAKVQSLEKQRFYEDN